MAERQLPNAVGLDGSARRSGNCAARMARGGSRYDPAISRFADMRVSNRSARTATDTPSDVRALGAGPPTRP